MCNVSFIYMNYYTGIPRLNASKFSVCYTKFLKLGKQSKSQEKIEKKTVVLAASPYCVSLKNNVSLAYAF